MKDGIELTRGHFPVFATRFASATVALSLLTPPIFHSLLLLIRLLPSSQVTWQPMTQSRLAVLLVHVQSGPDSYFTSSWRRDDDRRLDTRLNLEQAPTLCFSASSSSEFTQSNLSHVSRQAQRRTTV